MTQSQPKFLLRCLAIGALAGLLSGLFGVGGGFIMVPLFVIWLQLEQKTAHATSLLAIIFVALAGLVGYVDSDNVNWMYALIIFSGGVLGMFVGVRVFEDISARTLGNLFAITLLLVSARLLWSGTPHQIFTGVLADALLMLIGFSAGVLSGLLGIGGGVVIVPALILCSGLTAEQARGTSLVVIIGTAIIGTILHNRSNHINRKVALYTGLAGVPFAICASYIGATYANRIVLSLFALVLMAISLQLLFANRGQ